MRRVLPFVLMVALAPAQEPTGPQPAPAPRTGPRLPTVLMGSGLEDLIGRGYGVMLGAYTDGREHFAPCPPESDGKPLFGADSLFEIGSISKVVTALLLAGLVEDGVVCLDDTVQSLLPDGVSVPRSEENEIRLHHLASHQSGLPRLPSNLRPSKVLDPYADYTAERLYAFLADYELTREVGSGYEYSNLGFGLLGHALAQRCGRPYEALVLRRICKPLGMTDTVITLDAARHKRLARGHARNGVGVPGWNLGVLEGAGAWRSTPRDMVRFLAACIDADDEDFARLLAHTTRFRRVITRGRSIGLGWQIEGQGKDAVFWHNGATGGYSSYLAWRRSTRTGVVVLGNRAPKGRARSIERVGRAVLGHVEKHGFR